MVFWCLTHKLAIGWAMLPSGESPAIVYETLLARFQKIPSVVIYDNACNLSEVSYFCPHL